MAGQRPCRGRGVYRRGVQDGARRHDHRQVRPRRQSRRRVRDDSPDGLPRSRRHLHSRDQQLALAENPAETTGNEADLCTRRPWALARGTSIMNILKAALAVALVASSGSLFAQATAPEILFDTNPDLLKTPNDIYVGEIGGVGANSKGQIFVYT